MGLYPYRPLGGVSHPESGARPREFRILTILRGSGNSEIRCRLRHHQLPLSTKESCEEEYEALTWTWGNENAEARNITIVDSPTRDGTTKSKQFPVKPNLYEALLHLRRPGEDRAIWVDYICIDQTNTSEKNSQVKSMFHIYSKATNVCVWLGTHGDDSARAMRFISERIYDLDNFSDLIRDSNTKDDWRALAALMDRPWFSRRWIVQELTLAKTATVHCEDMVISWSQFETAVSIFARSAEQLVGFYKGQEKYGYDHEFFGAVDQMGATRLVQLRSNLLRYNSDGTINEYRLSLTDLVSNLWSFRALDPHDLIYAVLSLANDTHHRVGETQSEEYTASDTDSSGASSSKSRRSSSTATEASQAQYAASSADASRMPQLAERLKESARKATVAGAAVDKWKKVTQEAKIFKIFTPHYEEPFFSLCKEFLQFTIPRVENNNLDIIIRPWADEPRKAGEYLPSWIPRLANVAFHRGEAASAPGGYRTRRMHADPLVGQDTSRGRSSYYNASHLTASREDWKISTDPEDFTMEVTGFVLDKIGPIEDASQFGNITQEWLELGGYSKQATQAGLAILWRTLVADRGPNGGSIKEYYSRAFEKAIRDSGRGIRVDLKNRGHPILAEFLQRMEAVVTGRRLFKSKHGQKLGLAPTGARTDDCICIIRGISVPVVLRPCDQHKTDYTVVGEAYLHTMMDGNAIQVQAERTGLLPSEISVLELKTKKLEPEVRRQRANEPERQEIKRLKAILDDDMLEETSDTASRRKLQALKTNVKSRRAKDPLERTWEVAQAALKEKEELLSMTRTHRFVLK